MIPSGSSPTSAFTAGKKCELLVEKLERFVKFKPQTPLCEIIRLTAA
jgi:hypothetical protein